VSHGHVQSLMYCLHKETSMAAQYKVKCAATMIADEKSLLWPELVVPYIYPPPPPWFRCNLSRPHD